MKRVTINKLTRQAGVTILEFIAFIGLAALVIAGALSLYNTASKGNMSQEVFKTASAVATAARQVASGTSGGGAAATAIPAPTGWAANTPNATTVTFTKTGATPTTTIKYTGGASVDNFDLQITADIDVMRQMSGKTIMGVACSLSGTANVNCNNIPYN
ncbi:MAG: hypothetical protein RIR70_2135 [Pseudomonadota bacterium]|jgi:hypothetical protein